ncbi:MAG: hypothetical protein HY790_01190 [Deltaproteobacteria bacterium]|nr:hypothetical protein [Deltaproteobacteria bacterium]MBI4794455.1 hypothetical protein [Deltaproteobacteria bacterium]
MLKKIFPIVLLLLFAFTALAGAAQDTGLTFVGKIEEIAIKTSMGPMGGMEKNLAIKLDSKPKLDIRVTTRDASRFGLIDTDQPSAVLTPGKIKGLGWKVRLTCDKKTTMSEPFYMVTNLERLD